LIQTLMEAAKKEEAKNLSQLDQGYINQVEVMLAEIDKVYEMRDTLKKQRAKTANPAET
jgi:ABC-type Na+ efflux pump permease subunit